MATRFTTPLAAGVALALLAGPALAGQDAPFGGDAALSDEALGAQRAFGTPECTESCEPIAPTVTVEGDQIKDGGQKNEADGNLAVIDGNPDFDNTLDNDAMRGVEGVGVAIQNNGSNATISVKTDVTITDTAGM